MTVLPSNLINGYSSKDSRVDGILQDIADQPVNEVFIKKTTGEYVGTGMVMLNDGSMLAPEGFGVESGSVNFGDLITLSEAAGYLALWNHIDNKQYHMVDYWVPRDQASGKPSYFNLIEAEALFAATTDQSTALTTNPLVFNYTTRLDARTNAIVFMASAPMSNVRMKITSVDTGVVLKYLPTKQDYLEGHSGYNFVAGSNTIDFMDSPVPLSAGTMLAFEIHADSMHLMGSSAGVPMFSSWVQRGEMVELATANGMSGEAIVQQLVALQSPNKLPKSAVQDAVLSVNGSFGNVSVTKESIGAQPLSTNLTALSALSSDHDVLIKLSAGGYSSEEISAFFQTLLSASNDQILRGRLGLGSAAVLDTNVENGVLQLDENGSIPSVYFDALAVVAETGSYNDLLNRPVLFDGQYGSLTGLPTLFSGAYADLTGKPTLFSGSYTDLTNKPTIPSAQVNSDWNSSTGVSAILNKPTLFSGAYADLTGKPTLFTGAYSDLTGKPVLFSGSYADLTNKPTIPSAQVNSDWNAVSGISQILNKPVLFSGSYIDLTNKPTLFSGAYVDLTGKPTLFSGAYTDLTGKPTFATVATSGSYTDLTNKPTIPAAQVNSDWTAASGLSQILNKPTLATVATTGAYADLSGKPTIPAAQIQSDWNQTVTTALDYIKNKPTIPSNTSQITENTNLYYTDTRVGAYLTAQNYKKPETLLGTTSATGVFNFTFANSYSTPPHCNPVIVNGASNQTLLLSNVTTTGCTVTVLQRTSVTLLSVEVLLAATTPVSGATVQLLVIPR